MSASGGIVLTVEMSKSSILWQKTGEDPGNKANSSRECCHALRATMVCSASHIIKAAKFQPCLVRSRSMGKTVILTLTTTCWSRRMQWLFEGVYVNLTCQQDAGWPCCGLVSGKSSGTTATITLQLVLVTYCSKLIVTFKTKSALICSEFCKTVSMGHESACSLVHGLFPITSAPLQGYSHL